MKLGAGSAMRCRSVADVSATFLNSPKIRRERLRMCFWVSITTRHGFHFIYGRYNCDPKCSRHACICAVIRKIANTPVPKKDTKERHHVNTESPLLRSPIRATGGAKLCKKPVSIPVFRCAKTMHSIIIIKKAVILEESPTKSINRLSSGLNAKLAIQHSQGTGIFADAARQNLVDAHDAVVPRRAAAATAAASSFAASGSRVLVKNVGQARAVAVDVGQLMRMRGTRRGDAGIARRWRASSDLGSTICEGVEGRKGSALSLRSVHILERQRVVALRG